MNANELMIGGYLKYPKTNPFKIELSDFLNKKFWEDVLDGIIEPIPLTEDWLLKFGFKKQSNTYYISINCLTAELHFEDYGHNMILWLKSDNSNLILDYTRYVHQLQNLYFALTQKELTIKE